MRVRLASETFRVPSVGYLESVHTDVLEWPSATEAVEQANLRRTIRRGLTEDSPISVMEIALMAAFIYYDMRPVCQQPIGPYDADFYFADERHVVEVDGASHAGRISHDRNRDNYMAREGFTVQRVAGRAVFRDPLDCARRISRRLERKRVEA